MYYFIIVVCFIAQFASLGGYAVVSLNYRDSKPIYEQVKDGIRKMVVSGAVAAGERMPSILEFSTRFTINPNIVKKAYRDLEKEGYLLEAEEGNICVGKHKEIQNHRVVELLQTFDQVVGELVFLSVSPDSLKERVGQIDERGQKE